MLVLRRRIQADPASIAFAQLAEECRRLGSNEEAAEICRAGLARNPGYLSARVTLGRALIELGQLDAAKTELEIVVAGAPDNLAAIRGLAEILQRRGQMKEALGYYKRALDLAKHDPDLEDAVERISQAVAPPAPQPQGPAVSIEEIFNFDKLIDQLGLPPEPPASAAAGRFGGTSSASAAKSGFGTTAPELAIETATSEGGPPAEVSAPEPTPVAELVAEPVQTLEAEPASASAAEGGYGVTTSASAAESGFGATAPELVEEPPTSVGGSAYAAEGRYGATAPELVGGLQASVGEPELAIETAASEGGVELAEEIQASDVVPSLEELFAEPISAREFVEELPTSDAGPLMLEQAASIEQAAPIEQVAPVEQAAPFEDFFAESASEPAEELVILSSGGAALSFGGEETPLLLVEEAVEEPSTSEDETDASAYAAEGRYGETSPKLAPEPPASEGGPVEDFFAESAPEPIAEDPIPAIEASVVDAPAYPAEGRYGETSPKLASEPPASEGGPVVETAFAYAAEESEDEDSLAVMERELRELEHQRAVDERRARMELAQRRRGAMVVALETWLSVIVADRERSAIPVDRDQPGA